MKFIDTHTKKIDTRSPLTFGIAIERGPDKQIQS